MDFASSRKIYSYSCGVYKHSKNRLRRANVKALLTPTVWSHAETKYLRGNAVKIVRLQHKKGKVHAVFRCRPWNFAHMFCESCSIHCRQCFLFPPGFGFLKAQIYRDLDIILNDQRSAENTQQKTPFVNGLTGAHRTRVRLFRFYVQKTVWTSDAYVQS